MTSSNRKKHGLSREGRRKRPVVVVAGGGRVGSKAVRLAQELGARTYLLDRDPSCPARHCLADGGFIECTLADGYEIACPLEPSWVVPAAPKHLAALWLWGKRPDLSCDPDGVATALQELPARAVLQADRSAGTLVLSLAGEGLQCPESCDPPAGACASTGEPRPTALADLIRTRLEGRFDRLVVFESLQVAPGLGALPWTALRQGIETASRQREGTLAVATACACHGLLTCFRTPRARFSPASG